MIESNINYTMGEKHYKWTLTQTTQQQRDGYKYIFIDKETSEKIITDFVTPRTANEIEKAILNIINNSTRIETLYDFFEELQKTNYSILFTFE